MLSLHHASTRFREKEWGGIEKNRGDRETERGAKGENRLVGVSSKWNGKHAFEM